MTIEILMARFEVDRARAEFEATVADECGDFDETFLDGGPRDRVLRFKAVQRDMEDALVVLEKLGFDLLCVRGLPPKNDD